MKYPSDTELADLTGYTIARIKQLKGLDISCVSIDEPSGGDADGTLLDTLAADVQYEQKEIEHRDCKRQLDELLQKLNPRDRRIRVRTVVTWSTASRFINIIAIRTK